MIYTFKDLISCLSKEYTDLSCDLAILKRMIIINDINIKNYSFRINDMTNKLELKLEKNYDFWSNLRKIIFKKYGINQDNHSYLSLNEVINKIRLQDIPLNTNLEDFVNITNKIIKKEFYRNLKHPDIIVTNKMGSYLIRINSEGVKLVGLSGYLKDIYLIYDGLLNQMIIKSYGQKINTNDLKYLLNIKINSNLFNQYYKNLLEGEYYELELLTELNEERFKQWEITNQIKYQEPTKKRVLIK